MDLIRLLELLEKRLFFILVTIILAVIFSALTRMVLPERYRAKAVLWISRTDPETGLSQIDYNSLMMYRQLARTYGELATSGPVLQKLSGLLNGSLSSDSLKDMVTIRKVKDLELLEIIVLDTSQFRAAEIANTLAAILLQEEQEVWKMNNLQLITPALPEARPAGPGIALCMAVGALAGLFISVFLVVVMEYPLRREGSDEVCLPA